MGKNSDRILVGIMFVIAGIFIIILSYIRYGSMLNEPTDLYDIKSWTYITEKHAIADINVRYSGYVVNTASKKKMGGTRIYLIPQLEEDENGKSVVKKFIGVQIPKSDYDEIEAVRTLAESASENIATYSIEGRISDMPDWARANFADKISEQYGIGYDEAKSYVAPYVLVKDSIWIQLGMMALGVAFIALAVLSFVLVFKDR